MASKQSAPLSLVAGRQWYLIAAAPDAVAGAEAARSGALYWLAVRRQTHLAPTSMTC